MNIGYRVPTKIDAEPVERMIDLRQYLNFIWRNWMFIVSVTAFLFLMGVIYLVGATPLYTATTDVLLQAEKCPVPIESRSTDYYRTIDYPFSENQLAILRSDSLLRRVVVKERLVLPPPSTKELQSPDVPKEEATSAQDQSILNGINSLR